MGAYCVLSPDPAAPAFTRASMAALIAKVTATAGGEPPPFSVIVRRDWWAIKRGPRWRYPLPPKRRIVRRPRFRPLQAQLYARRRG